MAKPMLVTVPFVLMLLDYWPLNRVLDIPLHASGGDVSARSSRVQPLTLLLEKFPLLALAAASCILTLWAQRQVGAVRSSEELAFFWRLVNAVVSYATYIRQMFFPQDLSPYYPHPADNLSLFAISISALALAVITAAALFWRRCFPFLFVGWFWFLGMLVPVIGLVQVGAQGHADRYTYLPQIGLYLIIAWAFRHLSVRWSRPQKISLAMAGMACLAVLAVCAWQQTRFWRNSEILWNHALKCYPQSSWIEKALADFLSDRGRLADAIVHYRRGAQFSPAFAGLRLNFGNALYRLSRLAEAQKELEAAVQADPRLSDARISLGVVLFLQGHVEPAIRHFQQVLALDPANPAALSNLGAVFESLGRPDEAIAHYRLALSAQPAFPNAHRNLARLLLGNGRPSESIPHFEQALKFSPNDILLRCNLAEALAKSGYFGRASYELQAALELLGRDQEEIARKIRSMLALYQSARTE